MQLLELDRQGERRRVVHALGGDEADEAAGVVPAISSSVMASWGVSSAISNRLKVFWVV